MDDTEIKNRILAWAQIEPTPDCVPIILEMAKHRSGKDIYRVGCDLVGELDRQSQEDLAEHVREFLDPFGNIGLQHLNYLLD